MTSISKRLRTGLTMLTTAGVTGALLMSAPMAASAAPTVVDFASTTAAVYPYLAHTGGGGGTDWAPWTDADGLNAPLVTGAANWNGRAGWSGHNWAVQDDGSGTNNALWVQKGQAGAASSGIQVAKLPNGSSLISSSNKVITVKVKAADANVPVEATLTDYYGGHVLKVSATAATANSYNTLSFNFANATTGSYVSNFSYTTLSLVFDPANAIAGNSHEDWGQGTASATVSKVYIMDDLSFNAVTGADQAAGPDVAHKLTFEPSDPFGPLAAGDPVDGTKWAGQFEGAGTGVNNPPVAKSGKALEFTKNGNAWSGVNLFQSPAGQQITSNTYKVISLDYYSPDSASSPLQVQLEGGATVKMAVDAIHGWNHFDIDMSQATGWSADTQYTKIVLFPDFKNDGVGPSTASPVAISGQKYYIDNVTFNGFALPAKTGTPVKSGTAKKGQVLTASGVTWAGNTVATTFKWYRCTVQGKTVKATAPAAADKCSAISGATAATYRLVAADKGKYVRVAIIGTTAAGSVYALSTSTAKIG